MLSPTQCYAHFGARHLSFSETRPLKPHAAVAKQESATCVTSKSALQFSSLDEVHMWWAYPNRLTDESLIKEYKAMLSEDELQYVSAAADANIRKERLLSRVLTRTLLARYLGGNVPPKSLKFATNDHGKPHLDPAFVQAFPGVLPHAARSLAFNLTHTPSAVGLAVSPAFSVGLDVEELSRSPKNLLQLARRRFSAAEVADLEAIADEEQRRQLFIKLWTLKEAYVKCKGLGINAAPGLSGFSVQLSDGGRWHSTGGSEAGKLVGQPVILPVNY